MRVAAIDCGTNSIRLLVTDLSDLSDGSATDVVRRMEVVRLGEGVDRTGLLAPAALARTRTALADYTAQLRALGAERVRLVATSATRDAANRDDFLTMVRETLGIDPEVVSGEAEAALSFAGATRGLPPAGAPYLVVDIGGGSTELVLGGGPADDGGTTSVSVDVGCVRLTERHLAAVGEQPPGPDLVAAVVADAHAALATAGAVVPLRTAGTLVAVAGTATTVAGIALGLERYDADRIHLSRLAAAEVEAVTALLLGLTRAERAALPVMHPGRVDVIVAGALVLREVVRAVGAAEVVVSEHDILDGIAASLASR